MPDHDSVPSFAVMGHPNEGKSSVVSTLAEDDSVRVTPTPGETTECRSFPVIIDGREIIRFVDTPGFQAPKKTLVWMKSYKGTGDQIVSAFCEANKNNPIFSEEHKLFTPISRGAGIIYVVDCSRPLRRNDKTEMEIFRMTGLPRMAVINCKTHEDQYLSVWKNELLKHFNTIRIFNALNASYAQRIDLLESLKGIDPDLQFPLESVITAFKKDWERRNDESAEIICHMLCRCIEYRVSKMLTDLSKMQSAEKNQMETTYKNKIEKIEKTSHTQIKKQFKHNIFNYELPPQSILHEDLFSTRTWQVLGLTPGQLAAAGAFAGGIMGAVLDKAAAGLTFGLFTAIGGAVGAGSAFFGAEHMAHISVVGQKIGGTKLTVGPNKNIQFLYILLDRALIYYSHVINWAHGRRDNPDNLSGDLKHTRTKMGFSSSLTTSQKKTCSVFFKGVRSKDRVRKEKSRRALMNIIKTILDDISSSEHRHI